jgi:dinuclear metal center YbgI/SA1388 family protein
VGVALDPTVSVIDAAVKTDIDLLITHHPLIFEPLTKIDTGSPIGACIELAIRHRLAVFSAHTNMDKSEGGLNDILAKKLGLENLEILAPDMVASASAANNSSQTTRREGLGRIGQLPKPIQLKKLAIEIKKRLKIEKLKFVGNPDLIITRAAVCTGSGSSLLNDFFLSDAQVYISGDLGYHNARDIEARELGLIDIGHFPSEYLIVADLAKRLKKTFSRMRLKAKVKICGNEKDPFTIL